RSTTKLRIALQAPTIALRNAFQIERRPFQSQFQIVVTRVRILLKSSTTKLRIAPQAPTIALRNVFQMARRPLQSLFQIVVTAVRNRFQTLRTNTRKPFHALVRKLTTQFQVDLKKFHKPDRILPKSLATVVTTRTCPT